MKALFASAALAFAATALCLSVQAAVKAQPKPRKNSAPVVERKMAAVETTRGATEGTTGTVETTAGTRERTSVGALAVVGGGAVPVSLTLVTTGPLARAYHLLKHADRDYKGHRAKAMHEIEVAARLMGMRLGEPGRGRENQAASDAQVREAQSLLNEAAANLSGKPLRHVQAAIRQLTIALSIR